MTVDVLYMGFRFTSDPTGQSSSSQTTAPATVATESGCGKPSEEELTSKWPLADHSSLQVSPRLPPDGQMCAPDTIDPAGLWILEATAGPGHLSALV